MLILGIGNADRADDAAGVLVARRLWALGIDAREHTGDPLALIDAWDGAGEAILIDSVVSGAAPGTITKWDAGKTPLPPDRFCCSTHAFGLAEAVEIARSLGRLPARLLIYGIEGARFELGGAPSVEVADAVERVAQEIEHTASSGDPVRQGVSWTHAVAGTHCSRSRDPGWQAGDPRDSSGRRVHP
ncbi:MAG TPA: hydrogenase maturation protease [Bryobacteraceae bacterium]|nr:hydrogenase maturation protease [Bryobacteraceae bacterium]